MQTFEQIARLPAENNVVAQQVCPILLKELWQQNAPQQTSLVELNRREPVNDVYLRCLLQFADHCEDHRSSSLEESSTTYS